MPREGQSKYSPEQIRKMRAQYVVAMALVRRMEKEAKDTDQPLRPLRERLAIAILAVQKAQAKKEADKATEPKP